MIRLPALLFAAALALAAPALAQDAPPAIHPALFVMRDADSTLYLFGTVHVRPQGAPWGGPEAQAALAAADDVWTEIDISPETDVETAKLVHELGAAPRGQPLSSWLKPDEAERLRAAVAKLGLHGPSFENTRPWLAALTLTMAPVIQAGFDPQSGVDRAIDAVADSAGKQRRFFETAEQQIRFLADMSAEAQREMLLDAIDELDEGPQQLTDMTAAWEAGDLDALEHTIVEEMKNDYPELYESLFRARNLVWSEKLAHEMDGAGVEFVAVGAGHLVGEDGLVALLRARGFDVERVPAQ
jgi:uncharacterized protein